ncbi:hypothetical protein GWK77_02475 [Candidatus Saccharibacteria bacterium oral taxon 488]|nr:hypothetical protein GWK77_02475 [Candidatus Saccharibacteria bacterium oral taxon 488]
MGKKIRQEQSDRVKEMLGIADINEVFDHTIMKIVDKTQRTIETPTGLDEVGKAAREQALRTSAAYAILLVEKRRIRFLEEKGI